LLTKKDIFGGVILRYWRPPTTDS